MPTDLATIDLATLNTVREVIVASLRNHVCQWEQQSSDAVAEGRLSNAVMVQHWAFAADILSSHQTLEQAVTAADRQVLVASR